MRYDKALVLVAVASTLGVDLRLVHAGGA